MRLGRFVYCVLFLCAFSNSGFLNGQSKEIQPLIVPHVDERVELLSIVFRLAGNPEYNMDSLPKYSAEIDHYFAPYKSLPAVQMANALLVKNGVSFDAVMSMAISLSSPPELRPLVTFSATVPEARWGAADAEKFLSLLRDFYRDSKFAEFYAAHQEMYRMAETRFTSTLSSVDIDWYARFYGSKPNLAYHLVLGMNNGGGNYGPRLVEPDGRMELFSIIGCWTHDDAGMPTYPSDHGYLSTIIHEFNHSFVNPAVAEHWSEFSGAEQVFKVVAEQLRRLAYGNAQTMVDESLVRAAVIVYFRDAGEDRVRNVKRIRQEQRMGFLWMDQLVEMLEQYEGSRTQYSTFSLFMPRVSKFYNELAPKLPAEAEAYEAKSAHVASMEPFANHARDVDASVKSITIILDKPLDTGAGYSVNYGAGGRDHFPLAGNPRFEAGGLHVLLPVQLKPNESYGFVLTSAAFVTPDGYPLAEYPVEFKTK
jgi:hypothetical protein